MMPPRTKRGLGECSTMFRQVVNGKFLSPPEEVPRFTLNQTVPEMSQEKAVVRIYLSTKLGTLTGAFTYVPQNWLSTRYEMRKEMFLALVGLSHNCDKGNFPLSSVYIYFYAKVFIFFLF